MFNKLKNAYKYSFIKRIIVLTILFNIIFIILFVFMTYFTTKNTIYSEIDSAITNSVSSASSALDGYFQSASSPLTHMQNNPDIADYLAGTGSKDTAVQAINTILTATPNLSAIWCISDLTGNYASNMPVNDVIVGSEHRWYLDAEMSSGSAARIYLKSDGHESIVSADTQIIMVMPVKRNGEFLGCVGAELTDANMKIVIENCMYSEGAYPVILDSSGSIVSLPLDSDGFDSIFENSEHTIGSLIADGYNNGVINEFKTGRTTNYILSKQTNTGWQIVVIFDGVVADSSFGKMYLQQIIILACLFILELIATLNVIRHEAKDIPEISSSIAEISAGNYNFRINSRSENEIGLIAKSVDNLAQTLQDKNAVIDDYTNLDPTTGLYNRYKMYEYIEDLMVSRDDSRKRFALMFIDIDNFKWITETLGHRHGDEFLRIFGQRLKSVVSRVFRFSGDEFVILTEFNDDYGIIDEVIRNIKQEFIEPIEILNDKLYAQFSVGISIFPDDDTNPDMLLRDADIAVSRAKEKGKGRTSYYNVSLHQNVLSKATIAQKLNKALENHEMFLNFQPIISVQNGDIHGFEVLVRWESEELGYVSPFTFVQVAEETGAINEIGTWIFETACRYLKRMNEYNKDIIMSINVSPVQLKKSDFLSKVARTIDVFQINPANIQIEITETCLVDFIDGNNNIIQQIADMGISLALDDFGTGYSSFGYLKDMPIKCLKVDKSFVDEICSKHKDYQITGSIIDMVRNLGIKTVVEGVESIEQYNILSEMKCDYIQGFLMSKPLNATDAMEFVRQYDELHKPNRQSLEETSNKLAAERHERELHHGN